MLLAWATASCTDYVGHPARRDSEAPAGDEATACLVPEQSPCAGDGCVNLASDDRHCGACGRRCRGGERCAAGACACAVEGQTFCAGDGCVNPLADARHCGGCGQRCAEGGQCVDGRCGCPVDLTACPGACVDPARSRSNCGVCARDCDAVFANAAGYCAEGQCRSTTCRAGFDDCDGDARNGCEVDLLSSPAHCGGCGNRCAPARPVCVEGRCESNVPCGAGRDACGGACVSLANDDRHCGRCFHACGPGMTCVGGACGEADYDASVPIDGGNPCGEGQLRCNLYCVDVRFSGSNCGACGLSCRSNEACIFGRCVVSGLCPSRQIFCDDACVDPTNDTAHCGGCGVQCQAGQLCDAGRCARPPCPVGRTRCGASCVSLASDREHCGACGARCASDDPCVEGACVGACPGDLTPCDGACVDLQSSGSHCGACGVPCAGPNATGRCELGVCRVGRCVDGYGDCNGRASDGCETPLDSLAHCGGCGAACAVGQGCVDGECRCVFPTVRCGDACRDTQSDPAHCGACGRACASPRRCVRGACLAP